MMLIISVYLLEWIFWYDIYIKTFFMELFI